MNLEAGRVLFFIFSQELSDIIKIYELLLFGSKIKVSFSEDNLDTKGDIGSKSTLKCGSEVSVLFIVFIPKLSSML